MPKCPSCGMNNSRLFKCDNCGDIKCDNSGSDSNGNYGCATSKIGKAGQEGRTCYVCGKGKYRKICG